MTPYCGGGADDPLPRPNPPLYRKKNQYTGIKHSSGKSNITYSSESGKTPDAKFHCPYFSIVLFFTCLKPTTKPKIFSFFKYEGIVVVDLNTYCCTQIKDIYDMNKL